MVSEIELTGKAKLAHASAKCGCGGCQVDPPLRDVAFIQYAIHQLASFFGSLLSLQILQELQLCPVEYIVICEAVSTEQVAKQAT